MMAMRAWSQLSDLAFEAAMAGYLLALVCYGIEFASQRFVPALAGVSARGSRRGHQSPAQFVTAGMHTLPTQTIGWVQRQPTPPWTVRCGHAAVVVTVIAFAAQLVSLIARGLAVGRVPWGNMYEFTSMITGAAVASWLVILARTRARSMGFIVMLPIVVLVYVAGTVLYTPAGKLVPALQSYWLVIHVLAVSLSSGVLLLSGAASVAYLLRGRPHAKAAPSGSASNPGGPSAESTASTVFDLGTPSTSTSSNRFVDRLPPLETLDRIAYRTAIVAFPVYTFAVMAGALWAEAAWGRYWGWDPKETCAFITWILYASYLHARATAGWRGRRAAWISAVGFISVLFNFFFINMVVSGLHSYAGLN